MAPSMGHPTAPRFAPQHPTLPHTWVLLNGPIYGALHRTPLCPTAAPSAPHLGSTRWPHLWGWTVGIYPSSARCLRDDSTENIRGSTRDGGGVGTGGAVGPPHTSVWGAGADEVGEPLHGPPQLLLQRQHILHLLPPRQRHRPALHGLRGQRGLNGSTRGAEDPPRGAEAPPLAPPPPPSPPPPPPKSKTHREERGGLQGGGRQRVALPDAHRLRAERQRPTAPSAATGRHGARGGGAVGRRVRRGEEVGRPGGDIWGAAVRGVGGGECGGCYGVYVGWGG